MVTTLDDEFILFFWELRISDDHQSLDVG
jgi:hypothetical protein